MIVEEKLKGMARKNAYILFKSMENLLKTGTFKYWQSDFRGSWFLIYLFFQGLNSMVSLHKTLNIRSEQDYRRWDNFELTEETTIRVLLSCLSVPQVPLQVWGTRSKEGKKKGRREGKFSLSPYFLFLDHLQIRMASLVAQWLRICLQYRRPSSIPGLGRFAGEGNGNSF